MAAKKSQKDSKAAEITESMFYDKYYVIKKSKAQALAQESIKQLYEEGRINEHGVIEIVDILERMDEIQGAQYFAMNLDEEASIKAMQTYYLNKYDKEAAEACINFILKGEIGRGLVFKGKCLTSGKVLDVWRHPDGGKVFEVRDKLGNRHTVPEGWVIKWLEE
jgi:hypothetical protein